jgi:lipopolysaccharide export system permease protein
MMAFLTTIDIYILRRLAKPLLALSGITMMLLALENTPRLLSMTNGVERPIALIARFLVVLMPEHLAFGLMVGTFLSIAIVLRELALNHELEALFALGISPARLMRVPMLIGLMLMAIHVGLRGYAEPWGERELDHIGQAARSGDLGISITAGEFRHFGAGITLLAKGVNSRTGLLSDLFVEMPDANLTAESAYIRNGGSGGVIIDLENGTLVRRNGDGGWQATRFRMMSLPINATMARPAPSPAIDRADRRTSFALLGLILEPGRTDEISPAVATAALTLRLGQAAFIPLLPWLALALAIPPVRSTSVAGIAVGLAMIIAFIESGNMLVGTAHPILGMSALVALFASLIGIVLLLQRSQGLDLVTRGMLSVLTLRPRVRPRAATVHQLAVPPRLQSIRKAA